MQVSLIHRDKQNRAQYLVSRGLVAFIQIFTLRIYTAYTCQGLMQCLFCMNKGILSKPGL